jgi:predicted metal-dependent enzyme (double-stranded beta helix superfamily)
MATPAPTIQGLDELVDCLDAAVRKPTVEEITACVKDTLTRLAASGTLELPPSFVESKPDHYARRLVHRSDAHGYTVIAMTWAPGQGTALHDHSGMWCVEGVLHGSIEVTQYDLQEEQGDRYRFARQGTIQAGVGNAGALIPPFEYHTIANRSPSDKAVTLHVYAGEMTHCTVFTPAEDGWHERQERQLSYD